MYMHVCKVSTDNKAAVFVTSRNLSLITYTMHIMLSKQLGTLHATYTHTHTHTHIHIHMSFDTIRVDKVPMYYQRVICVLDDCLWLHP